MRRTTLRLLSGVALTSAMTVAAHAAPFATDNADNSAYDGGTYLGVNGGTGFNAFVALASTDGGTFETGNRQTDGIRSFSIYPGSTGYAVGRPLASAVTSAIYTVNSRHDLNSEIGFSGFNVKSTTGTAFADGELLRFGLPGTAVAGSGFNTITAIGLDGAKTANVVGGDGEIRGDILSWSTTLNTVAGTYTVSVLSNDGGTATITGTIATGSSIATLGYATFNAAAFQDFHYDAMTLAAVPEPATLGAIVGMGLVALRRRRAMA